MGRRPDAAWLLRASPRHSAFDVLEPGCHAKRKLFGAFAFEMRTAQMPAERA